MSKICKLFAILAVSVFLANLPSYAQEENKAAAASQVNTAPADVAAASQEAKDTVSQAKPLNIYGEVQGVNTASSSMNIQYYDYDTDEEKTIELSVSKDTKIENVPGLADIKKGDWADITYSVDGSKNIAKSVTVEKEEEVPAETMPEGETKE